MEFTHEQISEIISEITNGEQGLQGLGKQGFESLMLSERSLHNCSHQDVSNGYRDRRVCHEAQTLSHHSTLDDHNNRRQINNEINLELFCRYLFVFGDRNCRPGRFCRSSGFFYHWPAELLASSSDTIGRAFRKSKTTLARAPMVTNPDHLRLTLSLNCRLVLI